MVDNAHVLSPQTQADLTTKLAALEQKTGDQVVVVTLPDLQGLEIEDYGYQLGRAWGIGQKGKDNGLLLHRRAHEHKVRIEVGYGLEPVMTDAMSSVILQTQVLPKFRAGDYRRRRRGGDQGHRPAAGPGSRDAKANAQAAEQRPARAPPAHSGVPDHPGVFFIVSAVMRGGRRGGGGLWALPFLFMGGGGYRGGDVWRRRRGRRLQRRRRIVRRRRRLGGLVMYSKADHDRIHDAIADAETRTSGEIFCVVAKESGSYREVPWPGRRSSPCCAAPGPDGRLPAGRRGAGRQRPDRGRLGRRPHRRPEQRPDRRPWSATPWFSWSCSSWPWAWC